MPTRSLMHRLPGIFAACMSVGYAGATYAQEASATSGQGLEEVVVTAEKQPEFAQSAPLSLTVVSGAELAKAGVSQPEDLGKLVPGLTVTNTAITTISIRGVGAVTEFDSLAQLGVAVSTDGVYIDRATEVAGNFYDLNRVEAVYGPQGTLYGRNATGGAVNLVSNKPTQDFGGYVQEELGDYNLRRTTGAINVPVTDTFALRAAFYDSKRDGYTSDGYDDEDLRAGRLHALWTPNSDVSLLVTVEASRVGGQGAGNVFQNLGLTGAQSSPDANSLRQYALVPGPNGPQEIPEPGPQSFQEFNNHGARAQLDWNLGFGTLTYIPGYRAQTFSYQQDTVQGGLASDGNSNQFTNELRLSNQSEKWKWTAGLFSLNEHVDFGFHAQFVFFTLLPLHIPVVASAYQTLNTPNYDTRSDAAFGETTYSFTDTLRGFVGARYTIETKTADLINQWYGEGFNIPGRSTTAIDPLTGVPNYLYAYTTNGYQHTVDTTGRIGLEYDLAPKSLLYASVSQGFKGGGFGLAPPPQTEYKPEYLTAYALGVKNRFLGDRLQVNAEAYFWDYTDQQLAVIVPDIYGALEQITVNAAKSNLYGGDMSVLWAPTENDRLGAHWQYEHAIFGSYSVLSGLGPSGGGTSNGCFYTPTTFNGIHAFNENCAGLPLPFTPKWAGNANYTHMFSLSSGGNVAVGGDVHFASVQQTQITSAAGDLEHGYGIFDANVGYQSPKNVWSVTGYVRNIANKLVYTSPNPTGDGFSPPIPKIYNPVSGIMPPRTFGVILTANF